MTEFQLSPQLIAWGAAHGYLQAELEAHAEWFADYLLNRTKRYKDLNAAFRNCVRSDWGNIRRQAKKPANDWTATDQSILAKAKEVGVWSQGKDKFTLIREIKEKL